MTETTVGSICTGYGGLELALNLAGINHQLAWCSEIDEHASKVIARRFPHAPNLGDINDADPEPVDVITAGFPCQDISVAGRQAGIHGQHSGLWWRIRDVIGDLRPRYIILENVAAILTNGGPAVVASLTGLGYDSRWTIVRASDTGAPHQRARWFCVAWNTDGSGLGGPRPGRATTEPHSTTTDADRAGRLQQIGVTGSDTTTPTHPNKSTTADADSGDGPRRAQTPGRETQQRTTTGRTSGTVDFGKYTEAVHRWEQLTRPAPDPTHNEKLNPQFVEWMMGLPDGWVTDLRMMDTDPRPNHLSRMQMLRILGRGVVPQQAALALQQLDTTP